MEINPEIAEILPEIGLPVYPAVGGPGGSVSSPVIPDPAPEEETPLPDPAPEEETPLPDPSGGINEPVRVVIISENEVVEEEGNNEQEEIKEPYNIVVESPEYQLSSNVTVSVNTEEVNIDDLISAISQNRVSMNLSNNYSSVSSVQIVSLDSVPWFDKPFADYTVTEGVLLSMMVFSILGYIFNRLTRGFNLNDL